MAKKNYKVAIVFDRRSRTDAPIGQVLECLRYAGVISKLEEDHNPNNEWIRTRFYIYPPKGVGNELAWAENNSQRIRSFGLVSEVIVW